MVYTAFSVFIKNVNNEMWKILNVKKNQVKVWEGDTVKGEGEETLRMYRKHDYLLNVFFLKRDVTLSLRT